MKAFYLLLLPLLFIGCQSKPQGETIPLPASPTQSSQPQQAKNPSVNAETNKKDSSTQAADDETIYYHKQVKIRVKRDPKSGYSWELTGENVKDIVAMDRELRKKLLAGEETPATGDDRKEK